MTITKSLRLDDNKSVEQRTKQNMKMVSFEMAKNYLMSFTASKKSQVALVEHEDSNNSK